LQRNLLYTAITRGKQLVVLVGARKAVSMAVRNDSTRQRWTWLDRRIRAAVPPPFPPPGGGRVRAGN
jgi:exodeoxyribonuclease V alpha subunit